MDLDVTSPKQLNRRVFLKQLVVDLCTSEQRILFRAQYVRLYLLCFFKFLFKVFSALLLMLVLQPITYNLLFELPLADAEFSVSNLLRLIVFPLLLSEVLLFLVA